MVETPVGERHDADVEAGEESGIALYRQHRLLRDALSGNTHNVGERRGVHEIAAVEEPHIVTFPVAAQHAVEDLQIPGSRRRRPHPSDCRLATVQGDVSQWPTPKVDG